MNRKERRANRKVNQTHQTQSFEQLVSKANKAALEPYIQQQVTIASRIIQSNLAQQQLQATASILNRLVVLEKIVMDKLGYTKEQLAEANLAVQDEATGHVENLEGAKVGDFVRSLIAGKKVGDESFGMETELNIHKLTQDPIQSHVDIEKAMLGMKKGEEKEVEVSFEQKNEDGSDKEALLYIFKVKVLRVSSPQIKPEVKEPVSVEGHA